MSKDALGFFIVQQTEEGTIQSNQREGFKEELCQESVQSAEGC